MKQFILPAGAQVLILGVNLRREKHGAAKVPAFDVKVVYTGPNTVLDQLKGASFRRGMYAPSEEDQAALDGFDDATPTPFLMLEGIDPIHLSDDPLTGYDVTFDLGIGAPGSNVELEGAKLADFVVEPLQGGTVKVFFKVQKAGVGRHEIGELGVRLDCEVGLVLEPPEPGSEQKGQQGELGGGSE